MRRMYACKNIIPFFIMDILLIFVGVCFVCLTLLQVSLGSLTPYDTEVYGSDTTYYFTAGTAPSPAPKPSSRCVLPRAM